MNPQEALSLLSQLVQQIAMPYAAHVQAAKAVQVLIDALPKAPNGAA